MQKVYDDPNVLGRILEEQSFFNIFQTFIINLTQILQVGQRLCAN